MEYIVETEQLSRKFGDTFAVRLANIHVKKGDIYGLIGKNGAGKTTVLKMMSGFIKPSYGKVKIFGEDIVEALKDGRLAAVGSLIEAPGIHKSMTGHDNIKLKCILAGLQPTDEYIGGLLETVGLKEAEYKKSGGYSLGMKQRLGIALALVGDPEVLILDEPTNGLDPQGIVEVRELLLDLNRERNMTIIISSHILGELSRLVTTCGIIEKGELLCETSIADMEKECRESLNVRTTGLHNTEQIMEQLSVTEYEVNGNDLRIYCKTEDAPRIVSALCAENVGILEVVAGGQSLEDYFFSVVGGVKDE